MAVDRERLQVTELVRRKIAELRAPPRELTFRAIEKLWGISAAHIANLHNRKTLGVVGVDLEKKLAELYFGGSVDELRREARKIEIGGEESTGTAELVTEPLERYPNFALAAEVARRDAEEGRRPYVEEAVKQLRDESLRADDDPTVAAWIAEITATANRLRREASEHGRREAEAKRDEERIAEEKKSGRAGWGKGRKGA